MFQGRTYAAPLVLNRAQLRLGKIVYVFNQILITALSLCKLQTSATRSNSNKSRRIASLHFFGEKLRDIIEASKPFMGMFWVRCWPRLSYSGHLPSVRAVGRARFDGDEGFTF